MAIPKKSLGQNFLMHARIAERIALAANIPENGTVLEIGPGTGMLTAPLLATAGRVIAVEADRDLLTGLEEKFSEELGSGKLTLIHEDIRFFDPAVIDGEYHIVANIPYYLTGEIIRSFLESHHKPRSMTLLVQKEVANRIAREAKESVLSISVKAFGTPKYQFTVPRGAFFPAPNVDSAVISISDIAQDAFESAAAEARFFKAVKTGFAHKRKQLGKNLEEEFEKDSVHAALGAAGIPSTARSEEVPLDAWKKISALLVPVGA